MPVLAPNLQAFVSREVRETSLSSMVGVPHDEDDGKQQTLKLLHQEDDDGTGLNQREKAEIISRAATNTKKRQLYKQLSGPAVPWFPHDDAIELLTELCWEAGRPRWIFHGTPAGGAGVHGCLEAGSSVVALCFDEHHRTRLKQFLSERAVEAMVTGTTQVFKDEALLARSVELKLTTPTKTRKPEEKDSSDEGEIEAKPKAKNDRSDSHGRGQQRFVRRRQRRRVRRHQRRHRFRRSDADAACQEANTYIGGLLLPG